MRTVTIDGREVVVNHDHGKESPFDEKNIHFHIAPMGHTEYPESFATFKEALVAAKKEALLYRVSETDPIEEDGDMIRIARQGFFIRIIVCDGTPERWAGYIPRSFREMAP